MLLLFYLLCLHFTSVLTFLGGEVGGVFLQKCSNNVLVEIESSLDFNISSETSFQCQYENVSLFIKLHVHI